MIWNPGDDTDLNEGGDGTDTVEVNGGNGAEAVHRHRQRHARPLRPHQPRPRSRIDIGTSEKLVLNANGGDDSFSGDRQPRRARSRSPSTAAPATTRSSAATAPTSSLGGDGNDFIDGQQGNDVALLGAGDDTFQWDPGDGSDIVEGQDGTDTMLFNGANINENFDALRQRRPRSGSPATSATSSWTSTTSRRVDFNALGGADTITVNDLSGTDVTEVNVNLRRHRRRRRRRGRQRHRQRHQRRRRRSGHRQRRRRLRHRPRRHR